MNQSPQSIEASWQDLIRKLFDFQFELMLFELDVQVFSRSAREVFDFQRMRARPNILF